MPEVYVTMLSCSECRRNHPGGGSNPECGCWCHDGDDWPEEDEWDGDSV